MVVTGLASVPAPGTGTPGRRRWAVLAAAGSPGGGPHRSPRRRRRPAHRHHRRGEPGGTRIDRRRRPAADPRSAPGRARAGAHGCPDGDLVRPRHPGVGPTVLPPRPARRAARGADGKRDGLPLHRGRDRGHDHLLHVLPAGRGAGAPGDRRVGDPTAPPGGREDGRHRRPLRPVGDGRGPVRRDRRPHRRPGDRGVRPDVPR